MFWFLRIYSFYQYRIFWWVRGSENCSRRAVRGPEPCRNEPEGDHKRTPKATKHHSRANGLCCNTLYNVTSAEVPPVRFSILNPLITVHGLGTVAGIDLAAKPTKCSGLAVIRFDESGGNLIRAKCLGSDESILWEIRQLRPSVVAIDAPLMKEPGMRGVDKQLISMGMRVFPPNFSWMKTLSVRGWRLANAIMKLGIEVVEAHPRSALASAGVKDLKELLDALSIKVSVRELRSKDLIDAAVSAVVAYCVVKGCYEVVDDGEYRIYLLKNIREG